MASVPTANNLPMFYKDLLPLNSEQHATWRTRGLNDAKFLSNQHAIPITVDEFVPCSRTYPIIFSSGEQPVPLALMGMNEGVNTFIDDDGKIDQPVYLPAYIRRYPFLLARLQPDSDELSLCFDPESGAVGDFEEGDKLFESGEPSDVTRNILKFCEDFEQSGARTQAFMEELTKSNLLMDGEVSIQQNGVENPFIYRGFGMIDEQKLKDMRGDELRKMNQNGMLPLIHAHMFSLQLMRELFSRQVELGKMPQVTEAPQI